MSEDLTIKLGLQHNIDESIGALDRFHNAVMDQISTIGNFETQVTDLGSAMTLAMERPVAPLTSFLSLWRVGAEQARRGGLDATAGISSMAMAAQNIVERIGPLKNLAPVFQKVSDYARTAGGVIQTVRGFFGGLEQDMSVVMRMTSDMGETLRTQAYALQAMMTDQIAQRRAAVAELQKESAAYEMLLGQQSRLFTSIQNEKIANQDRQTTIGQSIALRQRDLGLIEREIQLLSDGINATSASGASTADLSAQTTRLISLELRRDKALADIADRQGKLQGLQQRSNDLDSQAANVKGNLTTVSDRLFKAHYSTTPARISWTSEPPSSAWRSIGRRMGRLQIDG